MHGPGGLFFEKRVQHLLELVLHPRDLKNAHRLVRSLVEHGVAHHDADLRRETGGGFPARRGGKARQASQEGSKNSTSVTGASAGPKLGECGRIKQAGFSGGRRGGCRFCLGRAALVQHVGAAGKGGKAKG